MKRHHIPPSLPGFNYLTGQELATFREVSQKCVGSLLQNRYKEIVTPVLEDWSLFVGSENRPVSIYNVDNIFSLITPIGEAVAMKYENTMPVCKFVTTEILNNSLKLPAKFCYISPQYRNERNISGVGQVRLREFYQVGWELFGKESLGVSEAMCTGSDLLETLGLKGVIKLSNVNIIGDVFDDFAVDPFSQRLLSRVIDKEDPKRLDQTLSSLDIDDKARQILSSLKKIVGDPREVLKEVSAIAIKYKYEKLNHYVTELVEICSEAKRSGIQNNIKIDLSIIRNKAFYSGVVFQYYLSKNSFECGGGGEYNRIIASLGGPNTPAVGAAFGLDRLIYVYTQKQ